MLSKSLLIVSSLASLTLAQVPGGPWTLPDGTCPGGFNANGGDQGSGTDQCSTDEWPTWCCPGDSDRGNGCNAPACIVGTQTIPITQVNYLTAVYLAAGTTLGGATTTGAATATGTTKSSTGAAAALMTAAPAVMAGAWAGLLLI